MRIITEAQLLERFFCHSVSDTLPAEITPELLDGVAAVHLDSRHTLAAIALATLANERCLYTVRIVAISSLCKCVLGHCPGSRSFIPSLNRVNRIA